jgi:hypothetical protein
MHRKLTSQYFAPPSFLLLLTLGVPACSSATSQGDAPSQEDTLAQSSALAEDPARRSGKAQPLEASLEYDVIRFTEDGADPCQPIAGRDGSWEVHLSEVCEASASGADPRGTPYLCLYQWSPTSAARPTRSAPEVQLLTALRQVYVAAVDPKATQPMLVEVALMHTADVSACVAGPRKVLPSTGGCDVCGARLGRVTSREMILPTASSVSVVSVGLGNESRYIVALPPRGSDLDVGTQERFLLPPTAAGVEYDEGPVSGFAQTGTAP